MRNLSPWNSQWRVRLEPVEVVWKTPMALLAGQPKTQADLAETKTWFKAPQENDFCETKEVLTKALFQNCT